MTPSRLAEYYQQLHTGLSLSGHLLNTGRRQIFNRQFEAKIILLESVQIRHVLRDYDAMQNIMFLNRLHHLVDSNLDALVR